MDTNFARFCDLKLKIVKVSEKTKHQSADIGRQITLLRRSLLNGLDEMQADRVVVGCVDGVELCIRRGSKTSTQKITSIAACEAWNATYQWDKIGPMLGVGGDLATAVALGMHTHIEGALGQTKDSVDVIKTGSKGDQSPPGTDPPRGSDATEQERHYARELWQLKAQRAKLCADKKAELAPLKRELTQLEDIVRISLESSAGESQLVAEQEVFVRQKHRVTNPTLPLKELSENMLATLRPLLGADAELTSLPDVNREAAHALIEAALCAYTESNRKATGRLIIEPAKKRLRQE